MLVVTRLLLQYSTIVRLRGRWGIGRQMGLDKRKDQRIEKVRQRDE